LLASLALLTSLARLEPAAAMHAVWRKRQGIPWVPEEAKGLKANAGHICDVGAIANIPPADPEDLTEGFGMRAHPKIVRAIAGTQSPGPAAPALRKKGIEASLEMFKGAANLTQLLTAGIVPALNSCVHVATEPDPLLRAAALVALTRLAKDYKGRSHMLEHDTLGALRAAATDEVAEVRGECLMALRELGKHRECMTPLVTGGFVKLCIDRCISAPNGGPPTPAFQASAAKALGRMCQNEVGLDEAIKVGAVPVTVGMLDASTLDVRREAAFCLAVLTHGQEEKAVALKEGVMRKCCVLLREDDEGVQTAAAATLMSMCNGTRFQNGDNACKSEAVKEGVIKALAPLLQPGLELELAGTMNEKTCALTVYICKAMASMADSPKGRKQLQQMCLEDLKVLAQSAEPLVQKNAQIAVDRITWTP